MGASCALDPSSFYAAQNVFFFFIFYIVCNYHHSNSPHHPIPHTTIKTFRFTTHIEKIKHFKIESDAAVASSVTQNLDEVDIANQMHLKSSTDKYKNALFAITPDGRCVGINFAYDMPKMFNNDAAREQWLRDITTRAVRMKIELENGTRTVESCPPHSLDLEPEVDAAHFKQLLLEKEMGAFFFI